MKAYPTYKDSGVKWFGDVPSHWSVMPLKYAAIVNREALTEQVEDGYELQYIDIGNVNQLGIVNPPERMKFADAPSRARRIIKKNDTIISTVRTYLKAVAFIDRDDDNLIASTGFATLTSFNGTYPKFLYYLVSNQGFVDTVSACSTGVSYPAITSTELARITAWLPPLPEQQAIADFLDRKTAQIDRLIEKKQRQIELLQEQRTALINHAVTKGLNSNAKMKDSGVEWLGEIPRHWDVKKGKYLFNIISGYAPSQITTNENGTCDYIKVDDLNTDDKTLFISGGKEKFEIGDTNYYEEGVVVFPKRGAAIFTNKVKITRMKCMFDTNLMGLQVFSDIANSEYIAYCLLARRLDDIADTSTVPQINNKHIYPLDLPFPNLGEQEQIIAFINKKTKMIDKSLLVILKEIELLNEYRTALISEAVTGKIDVRGETIHESPTGTM